MKLFCSSLAFLIIFGAVAYSVHEQNSVADGMLSRLEACRTAAVNGDMERLSEDFYIFSDYYHNNRTSLSLFLHTDRVEEIDAMIAEVEASLENGEENADDTDFDFISSSVGKLIDSSERIKEINSLSPSNIF